MGNQKLIGMVLLVAGTVLIAWGYQTSNSVAGQLGQAFGSIDWKVLTAYVVGVGLSVAGVRKLK
jgi:drug/metabolite transporter (DMT)-like permease